MYRTYFSVVPTEFLRPVKPFTSTCRYILLLTLSLEAYKESRQKRLVLIHRKYNLKTAILQNFIDRAANRLLSLGGTNFDSLTSRMHTTTYVWLVEACKESRQKRLVVKVKRKYNFNVKGHASGRTINGKSHH